MKSLNLEETTLMHNLFSICLNHVDEEVVSAIQVVGVLQQVLFRWQRCIDNAQKKEIEGNE